MANQDSKDPAAAQPADGQQFPREMRAKFVIESVERFTSTEKVKFRAVGRSTAYPADGSDENNTYAKYSPSALCEIHVANPALLGAFTPGQEFYVDFTPVGKSGGVSGSTAAA